MNTGREGFWKRWLPWRQVEEQAAQQSSQQTRADKQREQRAGPDSPSDDRNELPLYPKELKALLRRKLGLGDRPEAPTEEHPSFEQNSRQCASLKDTSLAFLFGEQNAQAVPHLARRASDKHYEASKQGATQNDPESGQDERLKSIEQQLNYLFGPDRLNRRSEFDGEAALNHMVDMMLYLQEKASIYVFHGGSYPVCSEYCELLWDKAVSVILLEQKITIVESPYEQLALARIHAETQHGAAPKRAPRLPSRLALVSEPHSIVDPNASCLRPIV